MTWINQHMPVWEGSKLPASVMLVCICKTCVFSVRLSAALLTAPSLLSWSLTWPSHELGGDGRWGYVISGNWPETAGFALLVASVRGMRLS